MHIQGKPLSNFKRNMNALTVLSDQSVKPGYYHPLPRLEP